MKLIFCTNCQDVVRLQLEKRSCECGAVSGKYKDDGLNAEVSDRAVTIGFDNSDLTRAIRQHLKTGGNYKINAFIIQRDASTIERTS